MRIQNYYYKDGDNTPVIVGVHNIAVPAAWCIWRDVLASHPDRMAFLDIPSDGRERVFLLALPGSTYRRIMFSVQEEEINRLPSICILYQTLLTLDATCILDAVEKQEPFTLTLNHTEPDDSEYLPISTADLNGLQLIGNTRQALFTVSRMLPKSRSCEFSKSFFLAVNPMTYHDAFSTVVSDEMPEGEWQKLKIEHTDYSNAALFHDRRRAWIRKHQRPRIFLQLLIFALVLLALCVVSLHLLRRLQWTERENSKLKQEKQQLEFQLRRLQHRVDQ